MLFCLRTALSVYRNKWPFGVIVSVFPGEDGRVAVDNKLTTFVPPISKLILLVSEA